MNLGEIPIMRADTTVSTLRLTMSILFSNVPVFRCHNNSPILNLFSSCKIMYFIFIYSINMHPLQGILKKVQISPRKYTTLHRLGKLNIIFALLRVKIRKHLQGGEYLF